MQKNPGAKTIEADLEEALFLSGAVPEQERGNSKRYDWARSARTDKGVSAVGQVVSGRFYVDPPGLVDRLNSNLASQIRIFGFKRVTPAFSAKKFCDRRRYVYLIPAFALDPCSHPDRETVLASVGSENELVKCLECSDRGRKVVGVMGKRSFEFRALNSETVVDSGISSNNGGAISQSEVKAEVVVSLDNDHDDNSKSVQNQDTILSSDPMEVSSVTIEDEEANAEEKLAKGSSSSEKIVMLDISSNNDSSISHSEVKDVMASLNNDDCLMSENETNKVLSNNGKSGMAVETMVCVQNEGTVLESGSMENDKVTVKDEEEKPARGSGFCYGEKEKVRFNRILNSYVGTHNFHNFTTRIKAEDPSAKRFIISFDAKTTVNVEGIEFVKCEVVGQSFMLHQIRKMIGLAVAIMRNCAPESLIETALQKNVNITVPTAPEVGLYLDECFFTSYNNKWKDTHEEVSMKAYEDEAEEFKMKHIYPHIGSTENKEGSVALWLHSLNHRNYPDLRVVKDGITTDGKSAEGVDAAA